ncbi:MAG: tetratricopeptide repeat protein [Candidatus Brocadiae bacterium]|nr:tetratricopeptide repeat protein [Candidatus Brocadiia bacterium]
MEDIYLNKLKKIAQEKGLAVVLGSRLTNQELTWKDLMSKVLLSFSEAQKELRCYTEEILEGDMPVEVFFRMLYQQTKDKKPSFLEAFQYQDTTFIHKQIAYLVKENFLHSLGISAVDNRLSLALKAASCASLENTTWLNGEISQEDFSESCLAVTNNKFNSLCPAGTRFFQQLESCEAVLVVGLFPGDFAWRSIYGYLTEYAKKNKTIYWVSSHELIPLTHIVSLSGGALINEPVSKVLKEIFLDSQAKLPAEFFQGSEEGEGQNISIPKKFSIFDEKETECCFFFASLLNFLMSRRKALDLLSIVITKSLQEKKYDLLAEAHRLTGKIFLEQGRLEKSIEEHIKAIDYWALCEDETNMAAEYTLCADNYWSGSAVEKSLQYYGEANSLYHRLEDNRGIAEVSAKLALICDSEEDYDLAQKYYTECLKARTNMGDHSGEIIAYVNLGNCLLKKQSWEEAKKYLENALELSEKFHDTFSIGEIYQLLGLIYMNFQEYTQSKVYYEKVYHFYQKEQDHISMPFVYCNLGHVCARLEDFDNAIKYYEQALECYEKMGDWQHLASVYTNLGLLYSNRCEYRTSEDYFSKAEEIFAAMGDIYNLIKTHTNLGKVYTLQGEMENAIECYRANMEMQIQLGDKQELANTLIAIAMVYLQTKQMDKTITHLQKAIALYDVLNLAEEKKEAAQILSIIQSKMANN